MGVALILAPSIFQFSDVGGAAVWIPRVLGVALIAYSIFTKYEWGLVKVVGMPYHLMVDLAASVFLAVSPFIFGFYSSTHLNQWLPHTAVGIVVVLVVLVSQTRPSGEAAARPVTA
ncbi:MAG: hypothetical protein ABI838_07660 [Chloroflexota bacterium]